jgi:hypothetical protein
MNIEHLLSESKKNARFMGEERNLEFIVSTFSVMSELAENKARNILYDYLHSKFMKSDFKNFNSFIEKELATEEGVQIKASIPRENVPEQQPEEKRKDLEEDIIYYEDDEDDDDENNEEEDSGDGSEEKSSEEKSPSGEKESSDQTSGEEKEINSFLDTIGLSDLDETQAMVYLERFKSLLEDVIESKEVKDLIIYLLYKAWSGSLSEGETLELKDLISQFNLSEETEESKEEDSEKESVEEAYSYLFEKEGGDDMSVKKIGVISSIVGSFLLFGVGGLLVSGLQDLEKNKFDIEKSKIEFQNKLKKDAEDQAEKNKKENPPEQKSNLTIDTIVSDGESAKDTTVQDAKSKVANKNQDEKETPEPESKKEPETSKEEPSEDQEKEDEKNLDPQEFHKKYEKCPKGWNWDEEKNACVQVDKTSKKIPKKKKESINYQVLLF